MPLPHCFASPRVFSRRFSPFSGKPAQMTFQRVGTFAGKIAVTLRNIGVFGNAAVQSNDLLLIGKRSASAASLAFSWLAQDAGHPEGVQSGFRHWFHFVGHHLFVYGNILAKHGRKPIDFFVEALSGSLAHPSNSASIMKVRPPSG
jgi:hypothetical protein